MYTILGAFLINKRFALINLNVLKEITTESAHEFKIYSNKI
jgi:hypothetical protein